MRRVPFGDLLPASPDSREEPRKFSAADKWVGIWRTLHKDPLAWYEETFATPDYAIAAARAAQEHRFMVIEMRRRGAVVQFRYLGPYPTRAEMIVRLKAEIRSRRLRDKEAP